MARFLAAALLALATCAAHAQAKPAAWPKSLTLGTASLGGTYVLYGKAWADLVNEKLGTHITIQQTQGPNEHIALTEQRQTDFGMTTMGVAQQAWSGKGEWTRGRQFRNIRATFPMYNTPIHFIALEKSGVKTVNDLHRRKAGVGPRGGTCGSYMPAIFKVLGIDATIRYGTAADMAANVQDGLIEAFPFCAGVPVAAYSELESANRVRFFAFTTDQARRIKAAFPELSDAVVPKGSYKQLTEDQYTVGVFNFAIAHKDLPEELVYQLVKTVLENNAQLTKAHAAARETVLENWKRNTVLPFHPGALRYLQERKISVPASLKPS